MGGVLMSQLIKTETREIAGREYEVKTFYDSHTGAPWIEHDGHGPVTEWESRHKAPGEKILTYSRDGSKRFYDFKAAVAIALRDGWSASEADYAAWTAGALTTGQRAERAARADYKRLLGWCDDSWHWIGIQVAPLCACGAAMEDKAESLWGVESDCCDRIDSVVLELVEQIGPLALGTCPHTIEN